MFAFRRALGFAAPVFAIGLLAACSAGKKAPSDLAPETSGGTGTGGSGAGGAGGSTGGTVALTGGSNSSGGTVSVMGGSAGMPGTGGSDFMQCAQSTDMGMAVPVDVYVMLDTSYSMTETTGATGSSTTKWDAVKSALTAFFTDAQSAGLSVALQFFPLYQPNVPSTCTSDADCGVGGPCLTHICAQEPNSTLVQCTPGTSATDPAPCTSPIIFDDGPCQSSACKLSGKTCSSDADCQTLGASLGSCVELGQCDGNADLSCPGVGQNKNGCGADGGVGMCVTATSHFCLHDKVCDPAVYQQPTVDFLTLPDTANALSGAMAARTPAGDTPTRPALRGAIAHAREWVGNHVGHTAVVVLATDGLPTACSGGRGETGEIQSALDDAVAAAQQGNTGDAPIQTFVIGVFGDTETGSAQSNLDRIAMAGGTDHAYVVSTGSNVQQGFLDALAKIRAARLACEYQIPQPKSGSTLEFSQVNVLLTTDQQSELYYVAPDACTGADDEWHYDKDPNKTMPTKIIACPKTCDRLKMTQNAKIDIQLGCMAHVR